ncbi:hypothetical protein PIB30_008493 [Stylosanthes scabra]|uniref:Uncharacterized protein n=1 Tax=Stylosanthes scabra TaxID=79078 RepID=A0ABU6Y3G1_9FABA|nr:hypothetical protein [Stylosanthes scabra]
MLSGALSFNGGPVLNSVPLPALEQLAHGAGFDPNSIFNSHVISARHTATISGINGQVKGISLPNAGVNFTGFRNNSLMHLASLSRFNPKPEMNNPMDHVTNSMDFGQDRSTNEISCTKRLTSNQIYNSCVIIPLRFANEAFPSRRNNVLVFYWNKPPTRMGLRWNTTHKNIVYLTRGRKHFAMTNGFWDGTELRFFVTPPDESTLWINLFE